MRSSSGACHDARNKLAELPDRIVSLARRPWVKPVIEQGGWYKIIIPPRATAVPNETTMQRDQHIATIERHGRMNWQRRSGYNRRSLVETAIYRYKTIINRRLQARTLSNTSRPAR